jgi:hypothetical protein
MCTLHVCCIDRCNWYLFDIDIFPRKKIGFFNPLCWRFPILLAQLLCSFFFAITSLKTKGRCAECKTTHSHSVRTSEERRMSESIHLEKYGHSWCRSLGPSSHLHSHSCTRQSALAVANAHKSREKLWSMFTHGPPSLSRLRRSPAFGASSKSFVHNSAPTSPCTIPLPAPTHGLKFRESFAKFREISFVSWVHEIFAFRSKKFVVFELPH